MKHNASDHANNLGYWPCDGEVCYVNDMFGGTTGFGLNPKP